MRKAAYTDRGRCTSLLLEETWLICTRRVRRDAHVRYALETNAISDDVLCKK